MSRDPDRASLSDRDAAELERFATYLRLVSDARRAGVPMDEAQQAIYRDVYPEDDER